jgi:hypothetical protein
VPVASGHFPIVPALPGVQTPLQLQHASSCTSKKRKLPLKALQGKFAGLGSAPTQGLAPTCVHPASAHATGQLQQAASGHSDTGLLPTSCWDARQYTAVPCMSCTTTPLAEQCSADWSGGVSTQLQHSTRNTRKASPAEQVHEAAATAPSPSRFDPGIDSPHTPGALLV